MKSYLSYYYHALIDLIYPKLCVGCGTSLLANEQEVCKMCFRKLPLTGYENVPTDNAAARQLWGRGHFEQVITMYHFDKGKIVRQLIHSFKYRNNQSLAELLGRKAGLLLKEKGGFAYDIIMPVPLHPHKRALRGYNQCELIAKGLSEVLGVEMQKDNLHRSSFTSTQTKKGRYDRWENVKDVFALTDSSLIQNKHILLVDDVLTTGATIEACLQALTAKGEVRVSVFALASV